jgi:DNA-binding GntR family transcriptional regulator
MDADVNLNLTRANARACCAEHRSSTSSNYFDGIVDAGDRVVECASPPAGVSQAPVREAIRDLVLLGFLETEHYKGTTVRSFTPQELWEAYTVRAALESLAARLTAARLTEAEEAVLGRILGEILEAGHNRDRERIIRLDNEFHETIIRFSGNQLLYQLWKTLEFARWTIYTYRIAGYDPEYLAARHEELLDRIRSRDPEAAMHAMQHHIEDLGKPPEENELNDSPSAPRPFLARRS